MKNNLIIFFFSFSYILYGQIQKIDTIYINQKKSTQLVYEDNNDLFELIDIGTGDLNVTYRYNNNVLILQSIVDESKFIETNLFIKTKLNTVFNYILKYDENPKKYTYFVNTSNIIKNEIEATAASQNVKTAPISTNNKNYKNIFIDNLIKHKQEAFRPTTNNISDTKCEFFATYIHDNKLYFKIKITNNSNLDYSVKDFFTYIKQTKKRKSTESERTITPLKIYKESNVIKGKSQGYFILEFDQFSISNKEEFVIEIKEDNNGQRDYKLIIPYHITNRPIIFKI